MKVAADKSTRKIRLLLVDDSKPSRMVQTYVVEHEFKNIAVVSVEQAPPMAEMLGYDGIILDERLPGERGMDIARRIYEQNWLIPLMIMTTLQPGDDAFEKAYDVVDYVATKSDPPMFINAMRAFIRQIQRIRAAGSSANPA